MRAMIRRDEGAAAVATELERAVRTFSVATSRIPGFISHVVVETADGALVSIAFCEDTAGLDAFNRLVTEWLVAHLPAPMPPPRITTGEVILQRGL